MTEKIAYISMGGMGGISINKIPVEHIEFGADGSCGIKDTEGNIFLTHLSNIVYIEREKRSEDNAEEKE
jgi:hypothetical protein